MLLNQNLKNTICLNCRKMLGAFSPVSDRLRCPNCGHEFLVLDNKIPILLKEYRPTLAASYLQHNPLIAENEEMIQQVRDARAQQPHRAPLLDRAIHAYEENNRYFQGLQAAIQRYMSTSEIEEMEERGGLPRQYELDEGIAFFYRDWCWSRRSEEEIATIMDTLFHQIDAFAEDVDAVLVPGAGGGRFACELTAKFGSCFALDYGLHMAQVFYDLLEDDLTLWKVNLLSNVARTEDVVVEHKLSLDAPGSQRIRSQLTGNNLSYFVGNALDVPLPDDSLSAIVCVYFIDIVPVEAHLREIRRLLKPGGLFLNLGPLRYPRGDVGNMLSGDELMSLFRESGFDILADDTVTNTQLASSPVITSVVSNNFMFVARNGTEGR